MRVLSLAILLSLIFSIARAADPDYSKVQIRTTRLAAHLFLLEGNGGNIVASIGPDGITLVDDEFAPLAPKIAAALKAQGITRKPVRYVINTHYHFDHTGGNEPFAQGGATVIAHDNARARLIAGGVVGNGAGVHVEAPPAKSGALPRITFDHAMTVHFNGEDIRALYFPAGHTDGDAVIFFPSSNAVHMGDDYVRYGFPFIDVNGGGGIDGMIEACETVLDTLPPDVKIVPGHGALSNKAELRAYLDMLKATKAAVADAITQGKSLAAMKQEQVLAAWSKQYSGEFINTDAYIDTLYAVLTHQPADGFKPHN